LVTVSREGLPCHRPADAFWDNCGGHELVESVENVEQMFCEPSWWPMASKGPSSLEPRELDSPIIKRLLAIPIRTGSPLSHLTLHGLLLMAPIQL
jgi:hypothetical protein